MIRRPYLLVIGERQGLAWVLRSSRMAFPAARKHEVSDLGPDDELFIYTTRGCFHNPTVDRGRVIGTARVASSVEQLEPPLVVGGREYGLGCELNLMSLAPFRQGVELAELLNRLDTFASGSFWGMKLRRPLVKLTSSDAKLLRAAAGRSDTVAWSWLRAAWPGTPVRSGPRVVRF